MVYPHAHDATWACYLHEIPSTYTSLHLGSSRQETLPVPVDALIGYLQSTYICATRVPKSKYYSTIGI